MSHSFVVDKQEEEVEEQEQQKREEDILLFTGTNILCGYDSFQDRPRNSRLFDVKTDFYLEDPQKDNAVQYVHGYVDGGETFYALHKGIINNSKRVVQSSSFVPDELKRSEFAYVAYVATPVEIYKMKPGVKPLARERIKGQSVNEIYRSYGDSVVTEVTLGCYTEIIIFIQTSSEEDREIALRILGVTTFGQRINGDVFDELGKIQALQNVTMTFSVSSTHDCTWSVLEILSNVEDARKLLIKAKEYKPDPQIKGVDLYVLHEQVMKYTELEEFLDEKQKDDFEQYFSKIQRENIHILIIEKQLIRFQFQIERILSTLQFYKCKGRIELLKRDLTALTADLKSIRSLSDKLEFYYDIDTLPVIDWKYYQKQEDYVYPELKYRLESFPNNDPTELSFTDVSEAKLEEYCQSRNKLGQVGFFFGKNSIKGMYRKYYHDINGLTNLAYSRSSCSGHEYLRLENDQHISAIKIYSETTIKFLCQRKDRIRGVEIVYTDGESTETLLAGEVPHCLVSSRSTCGTIVTGTIEEYKLHDENENYFFVGFSGRFVKPRLTQLVCNVCHLDLKFYKISAGGVEKSYVQYS